MDKLRKEISIIFLAHVCINNNRKVVFVLHLFFFQVETNKNFYVHDTTQGDIQYHKIEQLRKKQDVLPLSSCKPSYMKCKGFNLALSTRPRHKPAAYSIETAVGATNYSGLRSFNKPSLHLSGLPLLCTPVTSLPVRQEAGQFQKQCIHPPPSGPPLGHLPAFSPTRSSRSWSTRTRTIGPRRRWYVARALTVKNDRQLAGMVLEAITGLNVRDKCCRLMWRCGVMLLLCCRVKRSRTRYCRGRSALDGRNTTQWECLLASLVSDVISMVNDI